MSHDRIPCSVDPVLLPIGEGDLIQAARGEEVHVGRASITHDDEVFLAGVSPSVEQLERAGYLVSILERGVVAEPGYYVDARGGVLQIVSPDAPIVRGARRGPLPAWRGPWRKLRPEEEVQAETATAIRAAIERSLSLPHLPLIVSAADKTPIVLRNEHGHVYKLIEVDALEGILRAYGATE